MFNNSNGYSLADIAAATGNTNGNNGWGADGSAWWIIILFLFVFCGWGNNGNGFGNNGSSQSALTRGELCQDMNFADLETAVRGVNTGLCDGFYAMNTGMLNGFSNVQQSIQNGFAGVDNAICTLGYQTQAGINSVNVAGMQNTNAITNAINNSDVNAMQNTYAITNAINAADVNANQNATAIQSQIAQCCCDNKAQIADLKYTIATNDCALQTSVANSTRDIIDNQNANTRSILDFLVQDKISTLENENQALRLNASQQAQNNYLVSTLRPAPVPAFAVPAPYQFNSCNGFSNVAYGCC